MCNEYNGHENKATWLVGLWIDNDEFLCDERDRLVRQATGAYNLSRALQTWVEEEVITMPANGLESDLLGWALASVNWYELAKNYWEEREVEEDEDENENEDENDDDEDEDVERVNPDVCEECDDPRSKDYSIEYRKEYGEHLCFYCYNRRNAKIAANFKGV